MNDPVLEPKPDTWSAGAGKVPAAGWIYAYSDPGALLKRCHAELKRAHPGASHRYIAAALGLKSSAAFTQIVTGRINPTAKIIDGLAAIFGLERRERDYLAILFSLRHLKDPFARALILERIRAGSGSGVPRS